MVAAGESPLVAEPWKKSCPPHDQRHLSTSSVHFKMKSCELIEIFIMNCGNGNLNRLFVGTALFFAVGHLFAFECLPSGAQAWDAPACGNCFCCGDPKTQYKCDPRFLYCACHEGPNVQLVDPLPKPSYMSADPASSRTIDPSPVAETPEPQPERNDWLHFSSIYSFVVIALLGLWRVYVAKERLLTLSRLGNCVRHHRRTVRRTRVRFALAVLVIPSFIYLLETWWH
jgi:hypothetical protein